MNIHTKIPLIMAEIGAIAKEQYNKQQGFKYRGVDDVMNALQPLLHKHGVFIVPEVINHQREDRVTKQGTNLIYSVCTVKYTFYADDGSNISAVVIGEGMDSGDKATNKALAIAFKYACFQVFCIPTEEMKDPDAESPEPSVKKTEQPSAQKPEGGKPENVGHFTCADCGKVLKALKDENGKVISVREWAAKTEKQHGRPLCLACHAANTH